MTKEELLKRKEYCIKNNRCFVSLEHLEKLTTLVMFYDLTIGDVTISQKYYKLKN